MNAGRSVVVDASVALKWLLPDEDDAGNAAGLLRAFREQRRDVAAPSFIRYEVANALEQAHRQGRIAEAAIARGLAFFLDLGIHSAGDDDSLLEHAQRVAHETGASVYDAMYVAYAETLGADLVSSDERLLRLVGAYPIVAYRLSDVPSLL